MGAAAKSTAKNAWRAPFRTRTDSPQTQSLPIRLDPRPVIRTHRGAAVCGLLVLLIGEVIGLLMLPGGSVSGPGFLRIAWTAGVPVVIAGLIAYPFFRAAYWRRRIARGFAVSYPVWEAARYCAACDAVWIPAADTMSGLPVRQLLSAEEFRLVLRRAGGFERVS